MINSVLIFYIRFNKSTVNALLFILIDKKFKFITISLAVLLSSFRAVSYAFYIFCEVIFLCSELLFFMLIVLMWSDTMWLFKLYAER